MGQLTRVHAHKPLAKVALTTSATTTPELPFDEYSGGTIFIPSGSPITTLTFLAAAVSSIELEGAQSSSLVGTFYNLHNVSDAQITLTVSAGNCYNLPADLFGVGAIKITVNANGSVELSFKS